MGDVSNKTVIIMLVVFVVVSLISMVLYASVSSTVANKNSGSTQFRTIVEPPKASEPAIVGAKVGITIINPNNP